MKAKLFCNYCGAKLGFDVPDGKERQVCPDCRQVYYENPLPAASVILCNKDREVLLVKRANPPFQGMWCFPIGFAETGESIEDAALRELREEAGIDGAITQLVDVSSHLNPIYGELIIVTFEAEKTKGLEQAGDDASECRYFPISNLPKLAFDSQERALQKYKLLKKDLWSMHDSFHAFVNGVTGTEPAGPGTLVSDELIGYIRDNIDKIVRLWIEDIKTNPTTKAYHVFDNAGLYEKGFYVVKHLTPWLKGEKTEEEIKDFYRDLGRLRKEEGVPLEDLVSSLSLLRKHAWTFAYSFGVWEKAVDIYRVFELGERLVHFFDKAAYYAAAGYRDPVKKEKSPPIDKKNHEEI